MYPYNSPYQQPSFQLHPNMYAPQQQPQFISNYPSSFPQQNVLSTTSMTSPCRKHVVNRYKPSYTIQCKYFWSRTGCKYGNKCQFSHDNKSSHLNLTNHDTLCRFYGSAMGCKYGNNCKYSHSNPRNDICKDIFECFISKQEQKKKLKKRICIAKHPDELPPKVKFINLYQYIDFGQDWLRLDDKLQSIISNKQYDQIAYISKIDKDIVIKIINYDKVSLFKDDYIIYSTSDVHTYRRLNFINTSNVENYSWQQVAGRGESVKKSNLKSREIVILYITGNISISVRADDISSISYKIGEKIDFMKDGWMEYVINSSRNDQIEIGNKKERRWIKKNDENIAVARSYSIPYKLLSNCPSMKCIKTQENVICNISNQAIYYKTDKHEYILMNSSDDECIYRYDLHKNIWQRYIEYPSGILTSINDQICFDKETQNIYMITHRDQIFYSINVLSKTWKQQKLILNRMDWVRYRYFGYIGTKQTRSLHLIEGGICYHNHYILLPNDSNVIAVPCQKRLSESIYKQLNISLFLRTNVLQFWCRAIHFDNFVFSIYRFSRNTWCICCIDIELNKEFQWMIPQQTWMKSKFEFDFVATNDHYLHIIYRAFDKNTLKEKEMHLKISIIDYLIPNKLKEMEYYDPLLVYGWIRNIKLDDVIINFLSIDIIHIIMKFHSCLMHSNSLKQL